MYIYTLPKSVVLEVEYVKRAETSLVELHPRPKFISTCFHFIIITIMIMIGTI